MVITNVLRYRVNSVKDKCHRNLFHMAEDQKQSKRRRVNPTHRWTETQKEELLYAVADEVRDNVESFEKPTSQKFYEKIIKKFPLLKGIDWTVMKSKMRYVKSIYISAAAWKESTGAELLANGDEKGVVEYINKICPHFDIIEQIFGHTKKVKPPIFFETSAESEEVICGLDISQNHVLSENFISTNTPESSQQSEFDFVNSKNWLKTQKQHRTKRTSSSNFSASLSVQEKKLELETKRFELEKETARSELDLKRLQLEQEFELKKLEIEMNERVQKYELELKYKSN